MPSEHAPPAAFRPRLTLRTLTRGDGLLGLRAGPGFGPRGAQLTVAQVDWTLHAPGRPPAAWPAPRSLLGRGTRRVPPTLAAAEAKARDALWATALRPLPPALLQWRHPDAAQGLDALWALPEEGAFAAFWAEEVPRLQAQGWQVQVMPGFAHFSLTVRRWHLALQADAAGGAREVAELDTAARGLQALQHGLRGAPNQGSWRLSLGVEVETLDGAVETLDLAPLLAELIRREPRWLRAAELEQIADDAPVLLRAPGGRRIRARAGPLKPVVQALVDLLAGLPPAGAPPGPHRLSMAQAHRVEALREQLAASQAERAGPHGLWALQGEAGLAALVQRLRQAVAPPPVSPPAGLGLVLRPYQLDGLAWLQTLRAQHLGGILADDMGLGKTAQLLAHLLLEQQAGRLAQPALVLLPTTLIGHWRAEAARVAPALRVLALHGPQRHAARGRLHEHELVLTTYPLLWRDIEALAAQPWHLVVLDEAQQARNAGTRAAAALRRLNARHRLCVTGTPLENHLGELWAHFDWLMPGYLGERREFERVWRKPIERNGETLRAQALAQRVQPFVLRRLKAAVAAELPPKTEMLQRLPLQGRQRALYESVRLAVDEQVRRALDRVAFDRVQISVLAALLKLRQVCCDPRLLHEAAAAPAPSAKMEWLQQHLPALVGEGRRVLVFSQFTAMLALVAQALPGWGLPHLLLSGDTPAAARAGVVRRFQDGEVPLLLLSLGAGGVGLNLHTADTVIHLDTWWNPAVERQATDRAHRLGQRQPVFVYRLVAEGSIEERMLALQARKAALADSVLGDDAAAVAKFSAEDLAALLAPLA